MWCSMSRGVQVYAMYVQEESVRVQISNPALVSQGSIVEVLLCVSSKQIGNIDKRERSCKSVCSAAASREPPLPVYPWPRGTSLLVPAEVCPCRGSFSWRSLSRIVPQRRIGLDAWNYPDFIALWQSVAFGSERELSTL